MAHSPEWSCSLDYRAGGLLQGLAYLGHISLDLLGPVLHIAQLLLGNKHTGKYNEMLWME